MVQHEWSLDDERKRARRTPATQVTPPAMRRPFVEWEAALVQRVNLGDLSTVWSGWKSEIGVASRLGKNLHLIIYAAVQPTR